jgi:hypothetical protein
MFLPGGAYLPSYVSSSSNTQTKGRQRHLDFNDLQIRVGQVIAAYSATNENNRNKKYIEYDVEVIHSVQDGGLTKIVYSRCQVVSLFGGITDYMRWTLRVSEESGESDLPISSQVLIACVNGQTRYAYVIGGIPNTNSAIQETFEDNHHFKLQFNGAGFRITDDGSIIMYRRGATDADGTITNGSRGDASVLLDAEGNINLGYFDSQTLSMFNISKANDNISMVGGNSISASTNGNVNVSTSGGIKVNGATEAWVNGTTYRSEQATMDLTFVTLYTTLTAQITAAGAALTAAAPFLLIPVAGPLLASPFVLTAGIALTTAAPMIAAMGTAVSTFEASTEFYLSQIHAHNDFSTATIDPQTPDAGQALIDEGDKVLILQSGQNVQTTQNQGQTTLIRD